MQRRAAGFTLLEMIVVLVIVVSIPLLGKAFPQIAALTLFGVRVNWLVLGALLYPLFYLVGRIFVRLAEQGERDFMGIVDEGMDTEP